MPRVTQPLQLPLPTDKRTGRSQLEGEIRACGGLSEGRVVRQHPGVHRYQAGAGVNAQLVGEQDPGPLVCAERVTLPSAAVERRHEHLPETLAVGMVPDELLELGDGFGGAAQGEVRGDPVSGDCQPKLLEPARLGAGEVGVEPRICGPAPERQCLTQGAAGAVGPAAGESLLPNPREAREPLGVDLSGVQGQPVARPVGEQDCWSSRPLRLERVAQPQDEGLHGLGGAGRRILVPQRVDQLARCDQSPRGRDEPGQEQTLLASPDLDGALDVLDTQRTQDRDVHGLTVEERLHD